MSKLNSPHFLGYNGFAEETTLGKKDMREQLDFATELPVVWQGHKSERKSANGEPAKRLSANARIAQHQSMVQYGVQFFLNCLLALAMPQHCASAGMPTDFSAGSRKPLAVHHLL